MGKKSLPAIATHNQIKWHRDTIYRELIDGPNNDIGTANEIRLIKLLELVYWYMDNFGTPAKDYMPEMD